VIPSSSHTTASSLVFSPVLALTNLSCSLNGTVQYAFGQCRTSTPTYPFVFSAPKFTVFVMRAVIRHVAEQLLLDLYNLLSCSRELGSIWSVPLIGVLQSVRSVMLLCPCFTNFISCLHQPLQGTLLRHSIVCWAVFCYNVATRPRSLPLWGSPPFGLRRPPT
jgi:hypothetical protein